MYLTYIYCMGPLKKPTGEMGSDARRCCCPLESSVGVLGWSKNSELLVGRILMKELGV